MAGPERLTLRARVVTYGLETKAAQERLLAALHAGVDAEPRPLAPLDAVDAAASLAERLREVLRTALANERPVAAKDPEV